MFALSGNMILQGKLAFLVLNKGCNLLENH